LGTKTNWMLRIGLILPLVLLAFALPITVVDRNNARWLTPVDKADVATLPDIPASNATALHNKGIITIKDMLNRTPGRIATITKQDITLVNYWFWYGTHSTILWNNHFALSLIPFLYLLFFFGIFFVVQEGTRWQKHPVLGVFARFIQKSPLRGFLTFLVILILLFPAIMFMLWGMWVDAVVNVAIPNNTTPVVNLLLICILILAAMFPVMWSSFRTWRQAVRSAADVRVRTTS
jgi:hypothetical protein